jgi:NAD(P)-dependent dehydrogenase (short-subunit alcohol dehydrogenase family)
MTNGDRFQGAIALITGANKGIGFETARGLGAKKIVALIGARDETRGQAAAAKLKAEGIDARFVPLDVTNKETISRAARWIEDQFGPWTSWSIMLPLLRRSKHGRIVNVSSSLGSLSMANDPQSPISQIVALGYNTSKTALNSMTVQFANELRDTPIKVNAVCPGYCATDINGHSGPRSAAQGAAAPVQYATLGDDEPSSGVFDEDGPVA